MTISDYVLGVAAIACFLSATLNWPKFPIQIGWLGLACITAAYLF